MDIKQGIDSLQFDDDKSAHEEIETVRILGDQILLRNGTKFLLLKGNATQPKFMSKRTLISRFKQPRTKFAVHLNGRANHLFRQLVNLEVHLCALCASSVFSV
jgi:hypothetical protein